MYLLTSLLGLGHIAAELASTRCDVIIPVVRRHDHHYSSIFLQAPPSIHGGQQTLTVRYGVDHTVNNNRIQARTVAMVVFSVEW